LTPLPDSADWVDVTDHGVVGDGTTDNTAALNTLAGNTSITNWYFPAGSYLMKKVTIPSHVNFVFGENKDSTTIINKANTDTTSGTAYGVFNFDSTNIDNLIIDGMSFVCENKGNNPPDTDPADCDPNLWPYEDHSYSGPSGNSWRWYGFIYADDANTNIYNLNIRNCSLDVTIFSFNCIKFNAYTDGNRNAKIQNLIINNNYFVGYGEFAIEIIAASRSDDGLEKTCTGLRIFNNEFDGGGVPMSLIGLMVNGPEAPIPTDGTENRVFNNKHYNPGTWFLEHGSNGGMLIYNNEATEVIKKIFSGNQGVLFDAIGYNEIYQNHFVCNLEGGGESAIEVCGIDKWYENFISSPLIINEFINTAVKTEFGEIHNNTILYPNEENLEGRNAIIYVTNSTSGIIHDNELYAASYASKGIDYGSSATTSGNECYNNIINMKRSDGVCISKVDESINDHDNTCNLGWTGEYPTGRDGAGLHDDTVIGPGNYPV
jgi:hypothetical protein